MRIGIDYRPALVNPTGIGRYVRELVRAMVELAFAENLGLFGYTLTGSLYSHAELGISDGKAELVRVRVPSRWLPGLMKRFGRGADDLVGGADVYHHTQFQLLPVSRAVQVSTIYDCMYAHTDSGYMPPDAAERLQVVAREQVARSARILVPSQFVGAEVVMALGAHPDRVTVTELGCDHVARALPAVLPPPPDTPYILTVSRVDARKNHLRMLTAFELLVKEGLPHRWIIAGEKGYGCEPFEQALADSPAKGRVEWRQTVPDAELPVLYAQTDCFLFASLNEGFGLTPLEAMACGAPVVTSCVTSMPEVCGEAAFLVEPTDSERIFEAARRVLTEQESRTNCACAPARRPASSPGASAPSARCWPTATRPSSRARSPSCGTRSRSRIVHELAPPVRPKRAVARKTREQSGGGSVDGRHWRSVPPHGRAVTPRTRPWLRGGEPRCGRAR